MKVQIIGKVTGLPRHDAVLKFMESESYLTACGHTVVNPMRIVPSGATWEKAMIICIESLLTVDAVAIQPDWRLSRGANLEKRIAQALKLETIIL